MDAPVRDPGQIIGLADAAASVADEAGDARSRVPAPGEDQPGKTPR